MNYSLDDKIKYDGSAESRSKESRSVDKRSVDKRSVDKRSVDKRSVDKNPVGNTPKKPEKNAAIKGKVYTDEDIQKLLSDGYIKVHKSLWDHIPAGSHIRFIKRDDGSNLPRNARFKPGGFVKNHFVTDGDQKKIMIETKPHGNRGDAGYISFPIAYDQVDEIWKKYDRYAFIEIHLIYTSLAQKKKQIEELTARVNKLEEILRAAVRG
jgi:hypothetical protein